MRTFLAILIGCVLAAASAYAEDKIPAQTLAEIKEATVFVKADLGQIEGSGSGFVIKTEGDNVYVVTNDHVISPPKSATRVAQPVLSLVFKSGTKDERSVSAEVVASDPARDLAVLKASGLNPAPKPIDLREASEVITETMPVYIFGFPFGQALATSKASPAITVARGSVSSIRRDDREQVAVVQIDGAINPGNSGGPVVDARGRLVGVAVARIQDAQIGLAIPCEELAKMLNGRIVALTIRAQGTDKDGVEIKTAARLIDPLHKIKTVSVHIVQAKSLSQSPKRGDDGTWPALPDARRMDLEINDQTASAVFRISSTKPEKTKYLFQMSYVNGDGKLRYTNPIERLLDFSESSDVASRSGDEPKGGFAKNLTRSGDEAKGGFTNNRDQTSREPKGGFGKSSGRTGGGFARDDSPKISPTKEPLKGTTRKVADIDVTELKLDAKSIERCILWSEKGQEFYVLETNGTVRRIAVKDFEEQMRLETDHKTAWLSPSAEGLLLTVVDLQEVWVLDPTSLAVKRKIAVPSPTRVVSAPGLSVGFAASTESVLSVLDLKKGEQVRQYHSRDFSQRVLAGLVYLTMTPDGKYLVAQGGFEQMLRFGVEGSDVTFEEASPQIARNGQAVEISPDGYYAALPSGGGNYNAKGHPALGPYTTYIYKINDFTKPEIVVSQGAYPRALAFDLKAGFIYGQNHDHQLILFRPSGAKHKEYTLDRTETKEFSVHPDGGKLLVLTEEKLYFVELPEEK